MTDTTRKSQADRVADLVEGFFRSTDALRMYPRLVLLERVRNDELQASTGDENVKGNNDESVLRRKLLGDIIFSQELRSSSSALLREIPEQQVKEAQRVVETEIVFEELEHEVYGKVLGAKATTPRALRLIKDANHARSTVVEMAKLNDRSQLLSLMTTAEIFLSSLYRIHLLDNPGVAGKSSITIEEMQQFDSIEDAIAQAIEVTVETVLRKNVSEWLPQICGELGVDAKYIQQYIPEFEEAFMRRNIMVHNDGRVGRHYIKRCAEYVKANGIKRDDRLGVDSEYLERCFDVVVGLLVYISYVYLAKLEKRSEQPRRNSILNEQTLRLLDAGRYGLVRELSRMATQDQLASDWDRMVAKVNELQAMKWLGEEEAMRQEVEKIDWSAKDRLFSLARYVLLDEYELAKEDAESCLKSELINTDCLMAWPLFKKCRENNVFDTLLEVELQQDAQAVEIKPD